MFNNKLEIMGDMIEDTNKERSMTTNTNLHTYQTDKSTKGLKYSYLNMSVSYHKVFGKYRPYGVTNRAIEVVQGEEHMGTYVMVLSNDLTTHIFIPYKRADHGTFN